MAYFDSRGFTDSQDNQKDFNEKYVDKDSGPYIATVKTTADPLRMGRLGVNIPALTNTTDPKPAQIVWCNYLSPFYGVKSLKAVSKIDPYKFQETQQSYGMWAVPPDIDTTVLVIFAKGENQNANAFWMGCVQDPMTNQMVPGNGATDKTSVAAEGPIDQLDKQELYGTDFLPAGEKNRNMLDKANTISTADQWKYPINDLLAKQLESQGLIEDRVRGTTSSSARRESPSQVFGMNTPGRIRGDSNIKNIGLDGSPVLTDRETGHSFVMDDGAADGTNQLTRLRTASGHQLLMHDTEGVVYIANGSGNAYIEMQKNGRIDVYSGVGGINLRTEGDFNLHSDSNINMHANGQIRMSAAREMIQTSDAMVTIGEQAILQSSPKGVIQSYAQSLISSNTQGQQLHGASGNFHLKGSQVHLNAPMGGIDKWGPSWLSKDKVGMALRDEGDVELAGKGQRPLRPFTRKTKTTVHRFVTHEPMFRASVIDSDSIIPIDTDDKKQWSRLANTPGTSEYINNQNRLSENSAIRDAQYQADALKYIEAKMGNSKDATKAKELLTQFGNDYNKIYGISEKIGLPFDIKDSISEKFKGMNLNSTKIDQVSNLTSQVIENFSDKSKELFKDNVFVNSAGELFTLGETVSGISDNIDLLNTSLNSVDGLTKNLSAGNVDATIANLNSITQNYKSVIGGQVTAISQVKGLVTRGIAKFKGLDTANPNEMRTALSTSGFGTAIKQNLGKIGGAVKSFFSGFKFSDARLKEEIRYVGKSPSGINIYSFKYKQLPGRYIGVMAQEVPWARHMTDTGYYAVNYNKVDVEYRRLN